MGPGWASDPTSIWWEDPTSLVPSSSSSPQKGDGREGGRPRGRRADAVESHSWETSGVPAGGDPGSFQTAGNTSRRGFQAGMRPTPRPLLTPEQLPIAAQTFPPHWPPARGFTEQIPPRDRLTPRPAVHASGCFLSPAGAAAKADQRIPVGGDHCPPPPYVRANYTASSHSRRACQGRAGHSPHHHGSLRAA